MKVVILAGGYGTRLSEETHSLPKPMLRIGSMPVLWHIMKIYSHYRFNDFVILLGYRGYMIKEYFAHYYLHQCDITIDLQTNAREIHSSATEPWKITLVETGQDTMTGGRILRARNYIGDEPFLLTYGDGVADVNITDLITFHKQHGKIATMTTVLPEGRYGAVTLDGAGKVNDFVEKPQGDGQWVNAGYFVMEPAIYDYIDQGDDTILERSPLMSLAQDGEFYAYRHRGFWRPMDTLRDKNQLESLWNSGAPWKVWHD